MNHWIFEGCGHKKCSSRVYLADLIMSESVFHNMLPLNLNEFSPYLTVFVLGSWTRSFVLRL